MLCADVCSSFSFVLRSLSVVFVTSFGPIPGTEAPLRTRERGRKWEREKGKGKRKGKGQGKRREEGNGQRGNMLKGNGKGNGQEKGKWTRECGMCYGSVRSGMLGKGKREGRREKEKRKGQGGGESGREGGSM